MSDVVEWLGFFAVIAVFPGCLYFLAMYFGFRHGEAKGPYDKGFRAGYRTALQLRNSVEEVFSHEENQERARPRRAGSEHRGLD